MFRKEYWRTVFHLIFLIKEFLKKDGCYSLDILSNSVVDCLYDLHSWKNYGCWYWQVNKQDESSS